jgi:hypothetical protein
MRSFRFVLASFALGLSFAASASAGAASAKNPLDAALEERLRGKASLDDLEIEASWQLEPGNRSARVFGNGVGIWQDSKQFRLSREQVLTLVKKLVDAKVGTIAQPGAKPKPTATASPAKAPLRVLGELKVVAGSAEKSLHQLTRGEQSEALRALVVDILAFCEKASAGGVEASGLADGLAKLSDGVLAPETFSAIVRRQAPASEPSAESWLLRVNGRRVTDRLMPKNAPPPPPRILVLSDADFRDLVGKLKGDDPASLPNNLYAPANTDVTLEVLGRDRSIPARPYLNVTAETHGEKQKSFERIYALFDALHKRVQADGKAAPATTPIRQ